MSGIDIGEDGFAEIKVGNVNLRLDMRTWQESERSFIAACSHTQVLAFKLAEAVRALEPHLAEQYADDLTRWEPDNIGSKHFLVEDALKEVCTILRGEPNAATDDSPKVPYLKIVK